jgi:hypothetical protein
MTIETDIQAALIIRLCPTAATVQAAPSDITSPTTPVAHPLIAYTPTSGVKYLAAWPLLRAAPDHPFLPFDAPTFRRGIFQVDAVAPDNQGEGPGLRLAELVAARFAIGTRLTAGAYTIQLDKVPTIAAAVKDAPWVRYPVSIPYLVIT